MTCSLEYSSYGESEVEVASSCSALKKKGEWNSGYYHLMQPGDLRPSLVYCNMTSESYTDVPQTEQESSTSPIGSIVAWVPHPEIGATLEELQEGWVPCDGRNISKGPWAGKRTPDLNTNGHFLRGGVEKKLLDMQDDQLQDHEHVDSGHSHSATSTAAAHSHPYSDKYHDYSSSDESSSDVFCWRGCDHYKGLLSHSATTSSATVSVSTTISSHSSGLAGVTTSYRSGEETRPMNMAVKWVMRCW